MFVGLFMPHHGGVTVSRAVQMHPNTRVSKFEDEFAPHDGVTVSRAVQMPHTHTRARAHTHNPNTNTLLCRSLSDIFGEECRGMRTNLGQNDGSLGRNWGLEGQNGGMLGPDLWDFTPNHMGFGERLALLQVISWCYTHTHTHTHTHDTHTRHTHTHTNARTHTHTHTRHTHTRTYTRVCV